jgi:diaminohydroxyphosphoribosylaminopyrimidine deaminase/5-amino-6-(5-phosphoribosylamino)uracil reductase
MLEAIELAKLGRYSTRPNPLVGCVIVKDGHKIAEGWHRKAGEPHAEVLALAQAGERARGATVYVTLEPCSHFGKTPPCANALIAAGVGRVVAAMQDPNPLVSGRGLALLREAGISVEVGVAQDEAQSLNQGFIRRMQQQRPFVRLKLASSVDGRTAMASGESVWITGEAARAQVHLMRAQHGAIVTGIGTVLADNPSLNARLPEALMTQHGLTAALCHPIRVVLDPFLSMPLSAKMLALPGRTIVMTSLQSVEHSRDNAEALMAAGAEIVAVQSQDDKLDLTSVLDYLAQEEQVNEVMVEAGAIVAGSFIEAGLVDELHWFLAPHLMGHQGKPLLHLPGLQTMEDRIALTTLSLMPLGEDVHFVFKPEMKSAQKEG